MEVNINPLVSVVVPVYNGEKYIIETLESIASQTYNNIEILIVDDFSTDNSTVLVTNWIKKNNIDARLIILNSNNGSGYCRNIGQKEAKGRFIAFCDSDDVWVHTKIEIQIKWLLENFQIFNCTAYEIVNNKGDYTGSFIPPKLIDYSHLLKTCSIGTSTVIYDREATGILEMPTIRLRQDYVTWLNLFKKLNLTCSTIPDKLVTYRVHESNISKNKIKAARFQLKALKEHGLNPFKRLIYFCFYFFYGLLKFFKTRGGIF